MRKGIYLAALAAVLAVVMAPVVSASHVSPTLIAGNPSCAGGLKIEPVASGTYGPITISVTGSVFAFSASGVVVDSVIVKGGPNANLYDYSASGGVTSDTGLHSPINPSNGRPYGLSHLCFFFDDKAPPPPPPDKK